LTQCIYVRPSSLSNVTPLSRERRLLYRNDLPFNVTRRLQRLFGSASSTRAARDHAYQCGTKGPTFRATGHKTSRPHALPSIL